MEYRLFLSAVSDDYRADRAWLAAQFRQPNFHVIEQTDFGEYGVNTLVKLSDYIADPAVVVIHLVGPKLGRVPPPDVLAAFLNHLGGEAVVPARLPTLFETDAHRRLTYTQWEAWLAVFHGRRLLICEDTAPAAEATPGTLPVAEHLRLLNPERGYAVGFADRIELRDGVQKAMLRLLKDGTFHEDRPRNLPLATLGELFVGRDDFLTKLAESFRAARVARTYPNHLIHGVGGVGKTRAAVEYGLRSEHLYAALLFVNGETASDLERTLADLSGVLRLNLPAAATNPVRLAAVAAWLKAHPGWLLVVDNVDDEPARNAVNGWLAEWHCGHVVITGRYIHWGKDVVPLELGVLSPDDARDFLLRATDGRRKAKPDDAAVAHSIAVDDLGQLCLALEQASAYVRTREIALAEYQARWRANAKGVRSWADKVLMKYHEEKSVSLSVATTWQTSVEQLSADARRLLEMLSWLAPDPIPQTIFDALEQTGAFADTEPLRVELRSYSLLQRADDADFDTPGKVHRLVQLNTREQLPYPKLTLTAMLTAMVSMSPPKPQDVRTWPVWNPLQSHVTVLLQHGDAFGIAYPTSHLLTQLGTLLLTKAQYPQAEQLMRRALAIDDAVLGPNHPYVASSLNDLAALLNSTGRLAEAEPLMRRALAINENALGPDHPTVAIRLNNLAQVFKATGRLAEAEPLMRRALVISEGAYGADHAEVAMAVNNLAVLLQDTGRLAEAEPLMRRALAITENSLGPNHPNAAVSLNVLSMLLKATGRLAEAEPLMRRALAITENAFGPDHPTVAIRLNNLAQVLKATGRLAEAEPLMRRALAVDEAVLSPGHPNIAIRLNNLARLLQEAGRLIEAEPLFLRALGICHCISLSVGRPLPNLETALTNYRGLLEAQNIPADEIEGRLAPFQLPAS